MRMHAWNKEKTTLKPAGHLDGYHTLSGQT